MSDYAQLWKQFDQMQQKYFAAYFICLFLSVAGLVEIGRLQLAWYIFHPLQAFFLLSPVCVWLWIKQRLSAWPCPRCSKTFAGGDNPADGWLVWIRLPRQCGYCGLANGADPNMP